MKELKPGTGLPECKEWKLDNEIYWLEHYIEGRTNELHRLYCQRAWWVRFLRYCNGAK